MALRRIIFRGRCVVDSKYAGQWVEGGYVPPCEESTSQKEGLIVVCFGGNTSCTYHVDPDTVGQFTGMRDKHDVEIYEGDVVEVFDFSSVYASKYTGVVSWYRGAWVVSYEDATFGTIAHPLLVFDDFADRKTLVIGNIHDNPELLNNEHYEK